MTELIVKQLLIICPLIFLAGFVDAVAGGGGIISLPAYLLAGLPVHFAAGCNKFSAGLGTAVAAASYLKNGKVKLKVGIFSAIGAAVGSFLGTQLALHIEEQYLKALLLLALPLVGIFLFTNKSMGSAKKEELIIGKKQLVYSVIIGLFIGGYDGLIGPGTGTFLILAFSTVLGMELVMASGCAKISNLASNLTAMVVFIFNGKVIFLLAIPAALSGMLGGYIGAKWAIKGGAKSVRYVMFLVLGLLFLKIALEFLGK